MSPVWKQGEALPIDVLPQQDRKRIHPPAQIMRFYARPGRELLSKEPSTARPNQCVGWKEP
jgi:hypothetical protein